MTEKEITEISEPYIAYLKQNGFTTSRKYNRWVYKDLWVCDLVEYLENDKYNFEPMVYLFDFQDMSNKQQIGTYLPRYNSPKTLDEFKAEINKFLETYKKNQVQQKIVELDKDFKEDNN
jgi:hypothetical protein